MGIEDIQISEELETNAPSIKYRGDEGPKSPQQEQQMMIAQLEQEYSRYVFEMEEQGIQPMTLRQFIEQAMAEGQMSSAQPMAPQAMPPRQMAAFGGIMGRDGRRQYGIGSFLKKTVRKLIPNEIAEIAVKAAPFVAPFNPLLAAGMSGIGSFDQTGRMGSSIKSGLKNYALGQFARGVGGGTGNLQSGINPFSGYDKTAGLSRGLFTSPISDQGGLGKMFADKLSTSGGVDPINRTMTGDPESNIYRQLGNLNDEVALTGEIASGGKKIVAEQSKNILGDLPKLIRDNLSKVGLGNNLVTGLLAGSLGAGALMDNMTEEEVMESNRGEGLDIEAIRTEVLTAMKDPTGEALKAIRIKYPFLGTQRSKDVSGLAMGGRIGFAEGGGIMDLGGMEKDYRAEGGFVPIGKEEKADDVPARLSVNEFVFTADAVRNAGGGDIDKGAEVMENMMKNLEQGGQVSEESQGMQGARDMFQTSQRLGDII